MGLRRVVQPVGHTCEFNGVGERFRHAPWGIFGGAPGASGRFRKITGDGTVHDLPPKTGRMMLAPDEAVICETPGAGGYGPPAERAPEAIVEDRRSAKFSAEYLKRHYGAG
jgi:N-methylhydantoinase B